MDATATRLEATEKVKIEYQKTIDTKSALAACNLLTEHLLYALEDSSELSSLGHAETFAEQIKQAIDNKIAGLEAMTDAALEIMDLPSN